MKRRQFLQRTGLAAVGAVLLGNTQLEPVVESTLNADTLFAQGQTTVDQYVRMYDSKIISRQTAMEKFSLVDWPNHKFTRLEDTLHPAQIEAGATSYTQIYEPGSEI